jgi:hypothetical protein
MPPRITGSRGERAEACPHSASGPGFESEGRYARKGTGVHEYLELARNTNQELALAEIPHDAPHRAMCERIDLDRLPWFPASVSNDTQVYTEISAACDPSTGEAWRLEDSGRQYADVGEWQIAGTADVAMVTPGRLVAVIDIKTGNPTTPTRAADNFQLALYAVILCLLFGIRRARVGICFIREDGSVWTDWHDLDAIALYEIRLRILSTIERVRAAQTAKDIHPFVKRGDHCKYCPRFEECPAQLTVLRAMLTAAREQATTEIGENDVAEARAFVRDAKAWLEKVDETVRGYARVHPIPGGRPGTVYKEWLGSEREIVNGKVALKVLRDRYGADVAESATIGQTSVGAIEAALREHAKLSGKKMAPTIREAFDALKAAGAVGESETRTLREGKEDAA